MRRRNHALALALALAPLALIPVLALGQDVKDKAALDSQWKSLGHQLAEKHLELAKSLEKAGLAREAVEELALAILVDPEHKHAREKLGYKKDGEAWRGYPQVPPPGDKKPDEKLAKTREKDHEEAAKRISALAKRAKGGGLADDARRLAGIACSFKYDDKVAREVLGGEMRRGNWVSSREIKIRDAFEKAVRAAGKGEKGRENADDKDLEKILDLGELARFETTHGFFLATKAAPDVNAEVVCASLDATWAAHRYFMQGDDKSFSVEGEPKREITGGGLKLPEFIPRWVVVADSEHEKFVDKTVADASARKFNKTLGGTGEVVDLPSKNRILVYESHALPPLRSEWASSMMITHACLGILPDKARFPDFMLEGLRRFYSGHVSGKVDWWYVSAGGTGNRAPFQPTSFDDFRGKCREVLLLSFEGDLRALFARGVNELERLDSVKAFAFIDFCLARHRGELGRFMSELKADDSPSKTLETAFGKSLDDLERELHEWAREEY